MPVQIKREQRLSHLNPYPCLPFRYLFRNSDFFHPFSSISFPSFATQQWKIQAVLHTFFNVVVPYMISTSKSFLMAEALATFCHLALFLRTFGHLEAEPDMQQSKKTSSWLSWYEFVLGKLYDTVKIRYCWSLKHISFLSSYLVTKFQHPEITQRDRNLEWRSRSRCKTFFKLSYLRVQARQTLLRFL
jgi:hypothetical protein